MSIKEINGNFPLNSMGETEVKEETSLKDSPSEFDRILGSKEESEPGKDKGVEVREKDFSKSKKVKEGNVSKRKTKGKEEDILSMVNLKVRTFERRGAILSEVKGSSLVDSKTLVDEIVSKMRVGINRAGNSEVQIDLKSNVLEGLKIVLTLTKNGVVASFEAANTRVLDGIKEHLEELVKGLEGKGLKVSDVKVFLKEQREKEKAEARNRRNGNEQEGFGR